MSVLVATAYMEEAARFDWLVAMNAGHVLATGTPQECSTTGAAIAGRGLYCTAAAGETRRPPAGQIPPREGEDCRRSPSRRMISQCVSAISSPLIM